MNKNKIFILSSLLVITLAVFSLLSLSFLNKEPKILEEDILEENNFSQDILSKSIEICKTEIAMEIAYSVLKASEKYQIPVEVIYAIIATESSKNGTATINYDNLMEVNPNAKSKYNCIGLMQVSKFALLDYNKIKKTNYEEKDLYKISLNIEIGTWYYSQFKSVAKTWTEMYIIYNVGYGRYNKINYNWFYNIDGKWVNGYRNKFFFMNNLLPPTDSSHGLYGKNKLKEYGAKKRFDKCYSICKKHFNT